MRPKTPKVVDIMNGSPLVACRAGYEIGVENAMGYLQVASLGKSRNTSILLDSSKGNSSFTAISIVGFLANYQQGKVPPSKNQLIVPPYATH